MFSGWLQNIFKGLVSLVLGLVILQYFVGTITESYQREPYKLFNTRNYSTDNLEAGHNPLSAYGNVGEGNNGTSNYTSDLPDCPPIPQGLSGRLEIVRSPVPTILELEASFPWLFPGGHYAPSECTAKHVVAVVVPYRNRSEHLLLFLRHMHSFLHRQQVDYTLFVVEQDDGGLFNRAALLNVGFVEALKMRPFHCFIFHDVDLLPEDDRNLYVCPEQPRHMSAAVDSFHYRLPYQAIFGGVSAIRTEQFQMLNGFSNSFWGWGGEDDDMSNRIKSHGLHISRYPIDVARYTMLSHKKQKANPKRFSILKDGRSKYSSDGLSSLKYTIVEIRKNLLFTWILVKLSNDMS